jgi:hypothetical protein
MTPLRPKSAISKSNIFAKSKPYAKSKQLPLGPVYQGVKSCDPLIAEHIKMLTTVFFNYSAPPLWTQRDQMVVRDKAMDYDYD